MNAPARMPTEKAWPEVAARLGQELPRETAQPQILERMEAGREAGLPVFVACSGGLDSVCLALWFQAHFGPGRAGTVLAHYHHGLRGVEADGDLAFVRGLAEGLGLGLAAGQRAAPAEGEPPPGEAALRRDRMAFFRRLAEEAGGEVVFLLGHNLDDVAETQLLRLARGTSAAGLAGPRPVRKAGGMLLLRPFIEVPKKRLRGAMEAAGGIWREDASNASDHYARNRMRRRVVPVWQEAAPGEALAGARLTRRWMEEDEAALQRAVRALLGDKFATGETLDLRRLGGEPRALWRRALLAWWNGRGRETVLSHAWLESALDGLQAAAAEDGGEGRWSAGPGAWLEASGGILRLAGKRGMEVSAEAAVAWEWRESRLRPGEAVECGPGRALQAEILVWQEAGEQEATLAGSADPGVVCLVDAEVAGEALAVRRRRPGDVYQPLGAPGSRKLQDCFVDRKVPAEERNIRPVVCTDQGNILWCPGLLPSERHKISSRTKRALKLTYRRG